jgi:putative phosphoesterase
VRIGIVSDTHDMLRNVKRIAALFDAAGVARVVHTGDITQAKTLRVFGGMRAPLVGVFGNNDRERESLEAACSEYRLDFRDPPLRLEWAGRRLAVVHDPTHLTPQLLARCDVALHGHDHRQRIERRDGALVLNPGECAGHMVGHNAIGVLDLASLAVEILRF